MLAFGAIGFAAPAVLAGLLALPAIWWLLRMTPPRPRRLRFPPVRLLKGLASNAQTPAHSPWWLTLLRLSLATLVILALARPVLNPDQEALPGRGPLVILFDNGWTQAAQWRQRHGYVRSLITRAGDDNRPVYLAPTAFAGPAPKIMPLAASRAQSLAESWRPMPFAPDRMAVLARLGEALSKFASDAPAPTIFWVGDGLDHGAAAEFVKGLQALAGDRGALVLVRPQIANTQGSAVGTQGAVQDGSLGLYASVDRAGQLRAHVVRAQSGARHTGQVHAYNAKGERLGEAHFVLGADERKAVTIFKLPLELRNEITRIAIAGQRSAGAVHLLDERSRWKRVGVISGEARESAQPLLSPTYYIEKALSPFSEVSVPRKKAVAQAVGDLLERRMSVIVLADIGRVTGRSLLALAQWVNGGGMLIRFAGARLERGGDDLLPVPLRRSERTLGGALSWSSPQPLAPFEENTPFFALKVPQDVTVKRQVLADPAALGRSGTQIWARLKDGTPLVSAARRGKGWLVLFHVTANSDWSSLPMSGLFVQMLRRLVGLAGHVAGAPPSGNDKTVMDEARGMDHLAVREAGGVLRPYQLLDGFGQLGAPSGMAEAIAVDALARTRPGPEHPPGYYGPPSRLRALNLVHAKTRLEPFNTHPTGARVVHFAAGKAVSLGPWLLLLAFVLLVIDSLAVLMMSARFGAVFGWRRRGRAVAALVFATALAGLFSPQPALAGPQAQKVQLSDDDAFALKASLTTRLAYVITGNAEIDRISERGLTGLSRVLHTRTAFEPGAPMGVDIASDELAFFPLLYWPIAPDAPPLAPATISRIDAYMKQGGLILFDTRDQQHTLGRQLRGPGQLALQRILRQLDLPRLEPVPDRHVITRSFYLLDDFPGRWKGGTLWVEARSGEAAQEVDLSDGVSALLVTSNDFAGAWAIDEEGEPLLPVVPGGDLQREYAYRSGVNIVMYALTGNYKADQVHLPALLERLGQ